MSQRHVLQTDGANLISTNQQASCSVGQIRQGCSLIKHMLTALGSDMIEGRCAIRTPHDSGYENKKLKTFYVTCHYWTSPTQTRLCHLVDYNLNRQKFVYKASLLPYSNRTMQKNGHTMTGSVSMARNLLMKSASRVCCWLPNTARLRLVINVKKRMKEIKLWVDLSS